MRDVSFVCTYFLTKDFSVGIIKKYACGYFRLWEVVLKKRLFLVLLLFSLSLTGILCSARPGEAAEKRNSYLIKINKQQNVVTVYQYTKKGKCKPYKAFVCSTGAATPTGTFSLREKYRWHQLMGPSYGQYCTRIYRGFLFHSVWYYKLSKNTQSYAQYNRLGTTASHGCVRLTVADSKWIYDNCPSGTKVVIYNSANPGPLGKPKARKMSGYMGWDPTDPDPNNPYFIKVRSMKISAKKKTLTLGTKKAKAVFRLRVTRIRPKTAMIKKVKYVSSNPKVATVNQKGEVKAKQKGTCRIIVQTTDGSKMKQVCKITVKKVTPKPTPKPTPTPTPRPTSTPAPTATAEPTATPEPTGTPAPAGTATPYTENGNNR